MIHHGAEIETEIVDRFAEQAGQGRPGRRVWRMVVTVREKGDEEAMP